MINIDKLSSYIVSKDNLINSYTKEDIEKINKAFLEYTPKACRTFNNIDFDVDRQHMLLGYLTELSEIADAVKKNVAYNKPIDYVNIKEEIGDLAWYIAVWHSIREHNANSVDFDYDKLLLTQDSIETVFNQMHIDTDFIENSDELSVADYILALFRIASLSSNLMISSWLFVCAMFELSSDEILNCLDLNINKLKVRYPESFSDVLALDRNLDMERDTLEN